MEIESDYLKTTSDLILKMKFYKDTCILKEPRKWDKEMKMVVFSRGGEFTELLL